MTVKENWHGHSPLDLVRKWGGGASLLAEDVFQEESLEQRMLANGS